MGPKELFIFDLDGTLVNAYDAIEKSLNFTLRQFKRKSVSHEKAKRSVGKGDRHFIQTFFSDENWEEALTVYKKHHLTAVEKYSRALPGARHLLSRLRKQGKKVALATNRPSPFTTRILKALDIQKHFHLVLCADQVGSHKPKPLILNQALKHLAIKRQHAIFVGDMDIDMETAHRAKMYGLFIKGGSGSIKSVKAYKHIRIISHLREVLEFC